MRKVFTELAAENHLTMIEDFATFAVRASHYIAELNAVHPFREGNGRCQLTLLNILMELSGYEMNEGNIIPEYFLAAMIASFEGDNRQLAQAIQVMMR